MAEEFKYKQIPPFCRREGNALLYDGEGELVYYVPEDYFNGNSAIIEGAYIRLLGSFLYRIFNKNGNGGKFNTFMWPTMFLCRPSNVEKVKGLVLEGSDTPSDYRLLHFVDGDQLVTRVHTEHDIDNVSEVLRLHLKTGRVPNTIPYDELYMYLYEAMGLNGSNFDIHAQSMGLIYSKIARDPENIDNLFRLSKAIDQSMTGYTPMSIKIAAKKISPFIAITSENMDEAIMSAVLISDDEETGKTKHKSSPLERVMTM